MKKSFYLCIYALLLFVAKSDAQYYITSAVRTATLHTWCSDTVVYYVTTNAYTAGLSITTYDGHGNSNTSPINNGGSYGFAYLYYQYNLPGTYSIKHILFNGAARIDSVRTPIEFLSCKTLIVKCFFDPLGTGIYDSSATTFITTPIKLEVDLNGIVVDTITITSGVYYQINGFAGDIYSFKIISAPSGFSLTCPLGGIIYDTVNTISNSYATKYFGFKCSGTTGFDLSLNVTDYWSGIHEAYGKFYAMNASCTPIPASVTVNFSPKFIFLSSDPSPSSVSGNTITWNFGSISSGKIVPIQYYLNYNPTTGMIPYGDTLHSYYYISPVTGDFNPTNNTVIIIDTDRHSHDPNNIFVSPSGYIPSGTQLKYTINFENTGNDTAFNISVYDTLSPYLDPKSLDIVMASGVMNIAQLNQGGYNVVKFDFPNINLLDSSHHGQCDGAVIFTINTKQGLANGTKIDNRAGIYFDYNDVVMTNAVENIIGVPSGVATVGNCSKVQLYPNPVSDELTISMDNGAYSTMTVTNTIGQVMMTQSLYANQTNVNVQSLPAGIYYVIVRGEVGVKVMRFEKL